MAVLQQIPLQYFVATKFHYKFSKYVYFLNLSLQFKRPRKTIFPPWKMLELNLILFQTMGYTETLLIRVSSFKLSKLHFVD